MMSMKESMPLNTTAGLAPITPSAGREAEVACLASHVPGVALLAQFETDHKSGVRPDTVPASAGETVRASPSTAVTVYVVPLIRSVDPTASGATILARAVAPDPPPPVMVTVGSLVYPEPRAPAQV